MYFIPHYVDYYDENGAIYITSALRQNKVKLFEPQIIDEFKSIIRCGGCQDISTPLSKFLHEQEFLVNEQELDATIGELYKVMEESLLLTIMPTEGCNFRCPYCYEDHVPVTMTRRILDQLQTYITTQVSSFKHVSVGWFGGEPTLCKDVVLETNKLIQNLQKEYGFRFTSHITTNGYLLDIASFQEYYESGITSYQITLDGWNHDKTRPHISGKGTLQRILDNLTAISKLPREEYDYHIILRHNILPGDEDFTWYDYLHKLFGRDNRFSIMVRPVGNWGGETVKSMEILRGEERVDLMRSHVAYINKIGLLCENGERNILSKVCYASYPHSMVFRANGRIEKCTICLDHPKNLLGYLDFERGVVLDKEINKLWTEFKLKDECRRCKQMISCLNMKCRMQAVIDGTDASAANCDHSDIY